MFQCRDQTPTHYRECHTTVLRLFWGNSIFITSTSFPFPSSILSMNTPWCVQLMVLLEYRLLRRGLGNEFSGVGGAWDRGARVKYTKYNMNTYNSGFVGLCRCPTSNLPFPLKKKQLLYKRRQFILGSLFSLTSTSYCPILKETK